MNLSLPRSLWWLAGLILVSALPLSASSSEQAMYALPEFSTIRAFEYDHALGSIVVNSSGELNPSLSPSDGIPLSPQQIKSLSFSMSGDPLTETEKTALIMVLVLATALSVAILWKTRRSFFLKLFAALTVFFALLLPATRSATACWEPRHAFVFYDHRGNITGHLEVCFKCPKYRISLVNSERAGSGIRTEPADYKSLRKLFEELGFTVGDS